MGRGGGGGGGGGGARAAVFCGSDDDDDNSDDEDCRLLVKHEFCLLASRISGFIPHLWRLVSESCTLVLSFFTTDL